MIIVDRTITTTHIKMVVGRLGEDVTEKCLEVNNSMNIFLTSENPA
jgi:hypothetical protein